jgi:hypothetical protein
LLEVVTDYFFLFSWQKEIFTAVQNNKKNAQRQKKYVRISAEKFEGQTLAFKMAQDPKQACLCVF